MIPDEIKQIAWLHGEIKTPPFSNDARITAGWLLRRLQIGEKLSMPESKPMPSIGSNCHELRISDKKIDWRIMYHIHSGAIVILEVFKKKSNKTPKYIINICKKRLVSFFKDIK